MDKLEKIGELLKNMRIEMAKLGGELPKHKLCEDFTSTVQDIEVCVMGNYEPDDKDCSYRGSYTIYRVWIPTDMQSVDIQPLLTQDQLDRLTDEGYSIHVERAIERQYEKTENYYDLRNDR